MPSSRITPLAFHFERNKSEGYGYKQSFMKLGFSLELLNSRGLQVPSPVVTASSPRWRNSTLMSFELILHPTVT
jgi:hypothetical protein